MLVAGQQRERDKREKGEEVEELEEETKGRRKGRDRRYWKKSTQIFALQTAFFLPDSFNQ